MKTSKAGIDLIKRFEGLRLEAYDDGVGIVTIGYGHTKTAYYGMSISETEAEKLLAQDLQEFERCIASYATVKLNQNEFDALVSFAFNVGCEAFRKSTLLRELNAGNHESVPFQLSRWKHAGGRILNGLVRRRAAEGELFMRPVNSRPSGEWSEPVQDISPSPIREEREKLSQSRTARGAGSAVTGGVAVAATSALDRAEKLKETVSWLGDALAVIYVLGLLAVILGGLYALYCRRDDILKAIR